MDSKKMIWAGMMVGSAIGSFLPVIWGGDELSFSSLFLGAIGGFVGIWFGYKISR
jgi:hypothetical protein